MPGIILHDEDVYRLAQSVNVKQTEGYAPMGGILANNGMYYQPMIEGSVTAQYVVVREQESQNFIARADTTTAPGLGDIQYVDGFFLQAFGEEPGGGSATVAWGDVTGKPATFPPTTGTTAGTALAGNTQLAGIGGTLSVAKGGTGATTADAAWTALGGGAVGKLASLPVATTAAAGIIQIGTTATTAKAGNYTPPNAAAATRGMVLQAASPAATPAVTSTQVDAATVDLPTLAAEYNKLQADFTGLRTVYSALLGNLRSAGSVS